MTAHSRNRPIPRCPHCLNAACAQPDGGLQCAWCGSDGRSAVHLRLVRVEQWQGFGEVGIWRRVGVAAAEGSE